MSQVILFLKSHVAGYTRGDGTYVKPHERKDGPEGAPDRRILFTAPAAAATKADAAPVAVSKKERFNDPLDGKRTEVTLSNGKKYRIQRLSSAESMGLPGWHDMDAKGASYLADTEGDAIAELLRRE